MTILLIACLLLCLSELFGSIAALPLIPADLIAATRRPGEPLLRRSLGNPSAAWHMCPRSGAPLKGFGARKPEQFPPGALRRCGLPWLRPCSGTMHRTGSRGAALPAFRVWRC